MLLVEEALGQSEAFLDFQERLSKVAPVDRPVLLMGERGTGKELAASRLHYLSARWQKPLVTLNCAALTPTLIEAELFGYERGAFTGAERRRLGRFEIANGGTLFLDEIGVVPMQVQEKILRVVEYGNFERVGSGETVEVDVRIVGAANVNLVDLANKGSFKQDLLDRLCFEVLFLPPLRRRTDDILLLAEHFVRRFSAEFGLEPPPQFTEATREALFSYGWPGNIRELKNVVERAAHRAGGAWIEEIVFNPFDNPYLPTERRLLQDTDEQPATTDQGGAQGPNGPTSLRKAVADLELRLLREALAGNQYHQKKAAKYLDLTYDQFRGLLRKYGEQLSS